jgi:hypothetical protein
VDAKACTEDKHESVYSKTKDKRASKLTAETADTKDHHQ